MKRDDQVPHDDTDSGEAGEEVGSCSYFQICFSHFQICFVYFELELKNWRIYKEKNNMFKVLLLIII